MKPDIGLFDPPWEKPEWRAEVVDWIESQATALNMLVREEPETIHARPWSTVLKIATNRGNIYFKAGGLTQQFEPGLLGLLNEYWKPHTLPLLAADIEKGWSLLPEGGITFRNKLQGKADFAAWRGILQQYAVLQIQMSEKKNELVKVDVPLRSSAFLTKAYAEILDEGKDSLVGEGEDFLSIDQYRNLIALKPIVEEMFGELDAFQIPLSLEHGDLHDANIFAQTDGYKIFDWGDASLSHPFFTLLIPLRHMANKLGIKEYDQNPELAGLIAAYLQPWEALATKDELLAAWRIAHHLAKFARTINWFRVVKLTVPNLGNEYWSSVSGWYLEFLIHSSDRFKI